MIDTAFRDKIKKMSDSVLERQMSIAYELAYYESFGRDHEAHADALQEHGMLARECQLRLAAS